MEMQSNERRGQITEERIAAFRLELTTRERSAGTIDKYLRDVASFQAWLGDRDADRELAAEWKEQLLRGGLAVVTVNGMLTSLNAFFRCVGWEDCRVRYYRVQRQIFRPEEKELTLREYQLLVQTAREDGRESLALMMETLGATGIRVSELRYVTVGAAQRGRTDISLKGKIRTILLPKKLCRKLTDFAKAEGIESGPVFLSKSGGPVSRKQVWAQMKSVCDHAGVKAGKVFPHNLRHLFARQFYQEFHDLASLSDVLGHSSMETTRLYLVATGREHARRLDKLGLIT